jgi:hypothetical protein
MRSESPACAGDSHFAARLTPLQRSIRCFFVLPHKIFLWPSMVSDRARAVGFERAAAAKKAGSIRPIAGIQCHV